MTKYCWIPHPVHPAGIERLTSQGIDIISEAYLPDDERCSSIIAVIIRGGGFSAALMAQLPHLRVIVAHGVGTDGIDFEEAARRSIVVANTPGMNTQSVAEHTLAMILALAKGFSQHDRAIRQGQYQQTKYQPIQRELSGQTLGIVGFGAIGKTVARLCSAMDMNILVCSQQDARVITAAGYRKSANLAALLTQSDFVSLHVPATPANNHMIGVAELAMMKSDAFLINTSRGTLVDETALAAALAKGALAGAALDVFAQEPLQADAAILSAPNTLLTPHTAASTQRALENMSRAAAEAVLRVVNDEPACQR